MLKKKDSENEGKVRKGTTEECPIKKKTKMKEIEEKKIANSKGEKFKKTEEKKWKNKKQWWNVWSDSKRKLWEKSKNDQNRKSIKLR